MYEVIQNLRITSTFIMILFQSICSTIYTRLLYNAETIKAARALNITIYAMQIEDLKMNQVQNVP
jgi:hypothetical protein